MHGVGFRFSSGEDEDVPGRRDHRGRDRDPVAGWFRGVMHRKHEGASSTVWLATLAGSGRLAAVRARISFGRVRGETCIVREQGRGVPVGSNAEHEYIERVLENLDVPCDRLLEVGALGPSSEVGTRSPCTERIEESLSHHSEIAVRMVCGHEALIREENIHLRPPQFISPRQRPVHGHRRGSARQAE